MSYNNSNSNPNGLYRGSSNRDRYAASWTGSGDANSTRANIRPLLQVETSYGRPNGNGPVPPNGAGPRPGPGAQLRPGDRYRLVNSNRSAFHPVGNRDGARNQGNSYRAPAGQHAFGQRAAQPSATGQHGAGPGPSQGPVAGPYSQHPYPPSGTGYVGGPGPVNYAGYAWQAYQGPYYPNGGNMTPYVGYPNPYNNPGTTVRAPIWDPAISGYPAGYYGQPGQWEAPAQVVPTGPPQPVVAYPYPSFIPIQQQHGPVVYQAADPSVDQNVSVPPPGEPAALVISMPSPAPPGSSSQFGGPWTTVYPDPAWPQVSSERPTPAATPRNPDPGTPSPTHTLETPFIRTVHWVESQTGAQPRYDYRSSMEDRPECSSPVGPPMTHTGILATTSSSVSGGPAQPPRTPERTKRKPDNK